MVIHVVMREISFALPPPSAETHLHVRFMQDGVATLTGRPPQCE